MNILFVLEHYYPYIGGAEKLFTELTQALQEEGHRIQVITTRHDRSLPKFEKIKEVEIFRIDCFNRYLFTFLSLPLIIKLARKADIIHTTSYNAALPAWIGSKITRTPNIITFHEVWGDLWKELPFSSFIEKRAFYLYEQLILRLNFDRFIAVSHFTENALIQHGIKAEKIRVIYNGLNYSDFKDFTHRPPGDFTFTYFGRLGISKGLNLLIPAAAVFCRQYPDSKFRLIIPTQPKKTFKYIEALIEEYKIHDNLELKHNLTKDELYQNISSSSCIVIPSYSEGFCFVAAEAMAMNVPIISSGKGALKEVVRGPFIELSDMNTKSIIDALERAHKDKWTYLPKHQFDLKEAVKKYLLLYRE